MDNFHVYLKKQLLEYVEAERKKGVPLEKIEQVLLDAGHKKNIIDEVFLELEKEGPNTESKAKDPVANDLISQLKGAFGSFMSQASNKGIKDAKKDLEKTDTDKVIEEVVEEAEIIEEKTFLEGFVFFAYLLIYGIVVFLSAANTQSDFAAVFIGFVPALISILVSFAFWKQIDNVPLYMMIPLGVSAAFYGIGKYAGIPLFRDFEMEGLAVVNFFIGFLFNMLIVYVRFLKPKRFMKKVVKPTNVMHQKTQPQKHPAKRNSKKEIQELKEEFKI